MEIIRLRYPRLPLLGGLVLQARLMLLLRRRRREIKAIHCHIAQNMAVASAIINQRLRKPLIVKLTGMTELNGGILDPNPSLSMRLKRTILKQTMIQAISHTLGNRLLDVGFSPAQVYRIPNAVDLDRFDPQQPHMQALRAQGRPDSDLVVLYVGRLEAVKGLDVLMDDCILSGATPVSLSVIFSYSPFLRTAKFLIPILLSFLLFYTFLLAFLSLLTILFRLRLSFLALLCLS